MNNVELGNYRTHLRRGSLGNHSLSLEVSIPEKERFRAPEALGREIVSKEVKQTKKIADWIS